MNKVCTVLTTNKFPTQLKQNVLLHLKFICTQPGKTSSEHVTWPGVAYYHPVSNTNAEIGYSENGLKK